MARSPQAEDAYLAALRVHPAREPGRGELRGPAGGGPALVKRVRAEVSGTVQGVFFRETVRRAAEAHGVAGWVRNCADGRVEAVLEGDDDAVDSVVEVCRTGPDGARVHDVSVSVQAPAGLTGFDVR